MPAVLLVFAACGEPTFFLIPEGPDGAAPADGAVLSDGAVPSDGAVVSDGGAGPLDAGRDAGRTRKPLGVPCAADDECDSAVCLTADDLSGAPSNWPVPVCAAACRNSTACPSGNVCVPTGRGGRACVASALVGISRLGAQNDGSSCSSGDVCRSGLCANAVCRDTCASGNDCRSGTCAVVALSTRFTFPDTAAMGFACVATAGGLPGRAACSKGTATVAEADATCASGACLAGGCVVPCGSDSDCNANETCFSAALGSSRVAVCRANGGGDKPAGATCAADSDCRSGACEPDGSGGMRCGSLCATALSCSGRTCTPTSRGSLCK